MRTMKILMAIAVLGLTLGVARAEDKPDATVKLSGGSVAAGIGWSWGSGTLTYKGKEHPLEVQGLTVVDVGATKVEASGEVFNLKKLEDFDGNYPPLLLGRRWVEEVRRSR